MALRSLIGVAALAWSASATAAAPLTLPPGPPLSAAQIVAKHVAARGGLEAWRRIESMVWVGHVEAARANGPTMPFVLQLQRPNKTHFEISSLERRFTRIFDGTHGWRLRPGGNGAPELRPFSPEEVSFSRDEFVIDGPLMDHETKGVAVKLAGLDEIEGRKAYLLEVKLPSGAERRVWIDAQTFLQIRADRPSSSPMFKGAAVSIYFRDYRAIEGLQIPLTIETRISATGPAEKLVIDRVALNPNLPKQAFAKPATPLHRHAIVRAVPDTPTASAESGRPGP